MRAATRFLRPWFREKGKSVTMLRTASPFGMILSLSLLLEPGAAADPWVVYKGSEGRDRGKQSS